MIVTTSNQNIKIFIRLFPMLLLLGSCGGGNTPLPTTNERQNEPDLDISIARINEPISDDDTSNSNTLDNDTSDSDTTDNERKLDKQYIIGIRYYRNKDYKKAYEYFKELSELGYAEAQHQIGIMYENGEYVEKDTTTALKHFRKAVQQGDEYAISSLRLLKYKLKEEKTKKKRDIARQEKIVAEDNYKLGKQFYYTKKEAQKDNKKAAECFTIAAKKGHAKAQYELGLLFFKGEGVQKNYQRAKKWFRKSSNQRNRKAEHKLYILTLLMNLDINSSEAEWKRLFVNIGASEYWHALLYNPHFIDIDLDMLKPNPFYTIEMPDDILAGIVHYTNCHQRSIRSLRLKGRYIRFTPYSNQLTNLERLSLISNNLSSLPSCVNTFTGLKSLTLTGNKFKTFPACIEYLINLRELNLSYNKIISLPLFLSNLVNLERLNLNNNRITSIPNSVATLHLCKLDVSNNCLKTLPSSVFDNNASIEINLDYNPWFTINELCSVSTLAARNIIYSKLPYSLRILCANTILSHIQKAKDGHTTSSQYIRSIARGLWQGVVKKLNLCTEASQLTDCRFVEEDLCTMLPEELRPEILPMLIQEEYEKKTGPLVIFFKKINNQEIPIHLSNIMCTPSDINHFFAQYENKKLTLFTEIHG